MPVIRSMLELHPAIIHSAAEWLRLCAAKGYPVLVVETRREWPVMSAYYSRGRKPLSEVNSLYVAASLDPISSSDNEKIITKATPGRSWHAYGLAIDAVPLVRGKPDWDYNPSDPSDLYDEISGIAKSLGFTWGLAWNDCPHIELHPGWDDVDDALAWYQSNNNDWKIPIPRINS